MSLSAPIGAISLRKSIEYTFACDVEHRGRDTSAPTSRSCTVSGFTRLEVADERDVRRVEIVEAGEHVVARRLARVLAVRRVERQPVVLSAYVTPTFGLRNDQAIDRSAMPAFTSGV